MAPKISVIGTGYLGATHAAAMADLGFEVLGLDVVPEKVEALSKGRPPLYEPGLEEALRRHVAGVEGSPGGCGSPPPTRRSAPSPTSTSSA